MSTIQVEAIRDMTQAALRELGRLKFTLIANDLQKYTVKRLLQKERVTFSSGLGIERTVMVSNSNNARMTGLYNQDQYNVADHLKKIRAPWRHLTTNYAFDRRELLMNGAGPQRIVEILKVRRVDGMLSLIKLLEQQFWSKPADSTDELNMWGLPYWVVKSNNLTPGFIGGNPAGFADGAGGLSSTTYPNWSNWAGAYQAISKEDLVRKMREAHTKIQFTSPVDHEDYRRGSGYRYRISAPYVVIQALEELAEHQNDNLGRDIASMDGKVVFKRNAIDWVPYLDADADQPVYFTDYGTFHPFILRGDYLRENGPEPAAGQHNVMKVDIDLTANFLCVDRRSQAVLTKYAA